MYDVLSEDLHRMPRTIIYNTDNDNLIYSTLFIIKEVSDNGINEISQLNGKI